MSVEVSCFHYFSLFLVRIAALASAAKAYMDAALASAALAYDSFNLKRASYKGGPPGGYKGPPGGYKKLQGTKRAFF